MKLNTLKRQWSILSCISLNISRILRRSEAWSRLASETILASFSSTPSHFIGVTTATLLRQWTQTLIASIEGQNDEFHPNSIQIQREENQSSTVRRWAEELLRQSRRFGRHLNQRKDKKKKKKASLFDAISESGWLSRLSWWIYAIYTLL